MSTPAPTTTTTGQQAANIGRAWTPFTLIPAPNGAPFKVESRRDGEEPGTLERFTVWLADDPRPEAPHTHPWAFTSRILMGGYSERRFRRDENGVWVEVGTFTYYAGDVVEVPAGDAHVVFNVLPGTLTHMVIGRLTAGPKDWGHITNTTGEWEYAPVEPDPGFLGRFKALNTRPE
jgi:hypothetical protein